MPLPPAKQIIPPEGGWEPNTYYAVDVAFRSSNPVHRAIFYSGFLNDGKGGPGGYNGVFSHSYEEQQYPIHRTYYLKVIRKLEVFDER